VDDVGFPPSLTSDRAPDRIAPAGPPKMTLSPRSPANLIAPAARMMLTPPHLHIRLRACGADDNAMLNPVPDGGHFS